MHDVVHIVLSGRCPPHSFTHAQVSPAQSDHTMLAHGQLAQVYNIDVFESSSIRISCGLIESRYAE